MGSEKIDRVGKGILEIGITKKMGIEEINIKRKTTQRREVRVNKRKREKSRHDTK